MKEFGEKKKKKKKKKMKIMIIYPRFGEEITYRPTLGIAYLAAVLQKSGYKEIFLRDAAFYKSWNDYESDLRNIKPDVVGVSLPSALLNKGMKCIDIAKKKNPDVKIVVGGAHATLFSDKLVKHKNIDIAVMGEGEYAFRDAIIALDKGSDLSDVGGICFKKGKKIIRTNPRKFIESLSELPWPARDLLDMRKYLAKRPFMPLPYPATYMVATRGCFGNCLFCQPVLRKMFGMSIRMRDVKDVVDEIEFLIKKYKIKGLNIGADEPTAHKRWTINLCKELIRRKVKIKINVPTRVDTVDDEILKWMKKAGFIHLTFGVESGSQKILNIMRKGVKVEQSIKAIRGCEKAGICARANLMVGTPGETKETVEETIDFIKKAKPDFIMIGVTTPTPGSDLFKKAEEQKMLVGSEEDITGYSAGYIKLDTLSPDQVVKLGKKVVKEYKKQAIKYVINPFLFYRKRHVLKAIIMYFISLMANPRELYNSIMYHLFYERVKVKERKQQMQK